MQPCLLSSVIGSRLRAALEKARLENELSHAREQGDSERVAE